MLTAITVGTDGALWATREARVEANYESDAWQWVDGERIARCERCRGSRGSAGANDGLRMECAILCPRCGGRQGRKSRVG